MPRNSPTVSRKTEKACAAALRRTVEIVHDVLSVNDDYVTFKERYKFSEDETLNSRSTLRFLRLEEIESHAVKNGLTLAETSGNWQREPFSDTSPELIVRLTKTA